MGVLKLMENVENVSVKTCKVCRFEKSNLDFYKNRRICKKCKCIQTVETRKKRFKENPEVYYLIKEKNRLDLRISRKTNPEKFVEYRRKYLSQPEALKKRSAGNRRRRERICLLSLDEYHRICENVFKRDNGICQLCGTTDRIEFDHVYPVSLGGKTSTEEDLQLLCKPCNIFKFNHLLLPGGGMMLTIRSGG